ncbi:hypothetical protein ACFZDG_39700 [Kitasatospora xanthocidica]|uniref:hypothetical protein n=1 Tax=Kitasatospora xanthocidica TaxID=83382 RepID=UPI0036E48027
MGFVYGLAFIWGIGFPLQRANYEHVSAWWHAVIAALLIGIASAFLAIAIPRAMTALASGSAIGCLIGIVGAPFWDHANQEAGLAVGLVAALLVMAIAHRAIEVQTRAAQRTAVASAVVAQRVAPPMSQQSVGSPARSAGLEVDGIVAPFLAANPGGDATITLERGSGLRAVIPTATFAVDLEHVVDFSVAPGKFKDGRQLHWLTLSPTYPFMLGVWLQQDDVHRWREVLKA